MLLLREPGISLQLDLPSFVAVAQLRVLCLDIVAREVNLEEIQLPGVLELLLLGEQFAWDDGVSWGRRPILVHLYHFVIRT